MFVAPHVIRQSMGRLELERAQGTLTHLTSKLSYCEVSLNFTSSLEK